MRKHKILSKAASVAVCFGILLSNSAFAYDGARTQVARDVELSADGSLQGQVYTPEGRPVENSPIELRYQGTAIARTTTGPQGDFLITGVRGGAHQLAVGSMMSPVRLWKNGTAPEGALEAVVVAGNENVVRGQVYEDGGAYAPVTSGFGIIDVVTVAMLATSVTALVYAIEIDQDVDKIEKKLSSP